MRSLLTLLVFGVVSLTAVPGHAAFTVSIKEGSTTIRTLSAASPPGQTTTLFLLTCATPPCSQKIGNFTFEDISATNRARFIKTDGASVDKVEFKGVRVRSLVNGKKLTVQYQTADGDLTPLPGNLYPYTATMFGSFVAASGTGAAAGCTNPNRTFCVRLEVEANGNTVNLSGSEILASVSVPPISTLTGSLPAGLSDSETINCGTQGVAGSCRPQLTATLVAFFDVKGETLTLPGSAITGNGNRATQDEGGVDLCADISEMGCQDAFLLFTATAQNFKAVPKSPRADAVINAGRAVELRFELQRPTQIVPADKVTLIALDPGSAEMGAGDQAAASRAFLAFVPADLTPTQLRTLIFDYDVIVDEEFSDCVDRSLRVEITFDRPDGRVEGPVVIALGSAPDFGSGCKDAGLSGLDLLDNHDRRADTTALGNRCCTEPLGLMNRLGGADGRRVRSVSFVLEARPGIDQKVELRRAEVNASVFTPVETTGFVRSCEVPANGRTIRITKRTGPDAGREFVVPDEDVKKGTCALQAKVNTNLLEPDPGGLTTYRAELCVSGRCLVDFVEFDVRTP
jgi:hypothetical protein